MIKRFRLLTIGFIFIAGTSVFLPSCQKFLNPNEELAITEDKLYGDWYEYRSAEMGLYGLQQRLVEQLVVLGELRGDLLTVTPNAEPDLVEVNNFNISKTNKYASPTNFFKLIAASNSFIRELKKKHPEILSPTSEITNFHKLYGEALCMRAWAYFNAVRIYGKVPFIPESLTSMEEIENFVNSPGIYIDSVDIAFNPDGYHNDTTYNKPDTLTHQFYDINLVLDHFTNQLEKEVRAVGVNHYINNNDQTWEVTIWSTWSWHALLGSMYLYQGNLTKAANHFLPIVRNTSDNRRYQLDNAFSNYNWRSIFTSIDNREHIYTIWFNKANFQQNQLQDFFEPFSMHKYMMKPTPFAIRNWETVWRGQVIEKHDDMPWKTKMLVPGSPSDYFRGYGSSYLYIKNGDALSEDEYTSMLTLRAQGDDRSSKVIMEGVDTMVYKYSINKDRYDEDANFIVYRAGSIHLYLSEIYIYWAFQQPSGVFPNTTEGLGYLNDGSPYNSMSNRAQLGVRGRVGLGGMPPYSTPEDAVKAGDVYYLHDPATNKVIGYRYLNYAQKQQVLEEQVLDERARELAFEGERFYDLMRIAQRRNDPSFLAKKVSEKFSGAQKDLIYNLLLNENNWYVHYFDSK